MKKTLLLLYIFALITSCKKEKEEPVVAGPVVVLDQLKVEENITGIWKGILTGSNRTTENVEVTVQEMILANKVATGKYFDPTFSCGFEWTYESFANGRVLFREKTLNSNICSDNVAVYGRFQDEDFDTLHLQITIGNVFYSGALTRQ